MRSQVARNPVSSQKSRNLRRLLTDVLEEATARGFGLGVAERIRQARTEAGLTQPQLAELIDVGLRQVQYYESGESDPYRKLNKIAEVTGKSVGWLLHGDDPTPLQPDLGERLDRLELLLAEVLRRLDDQADSQA